MSQANSLWDKAKDILLPICNRIIKEHHDQQISADEEQPELSSSSDSEFTSNCDNDEHTATD